LRKVKRESPRQPKDDMGFWLCRVPGCGKRIPKGRSSYCCSACATAFEIAYFPSQTRRHVFKRDRGFCGKCGCDTERLRRIIRTLSWGVRTWVSRELGFNGGMLHRGDLWQADHIVECVNGGWGTGLDNLRTLCTPCHKEETARLARELAEKRRAEKLALRSPNDEAYLFGSEVA
jgi:5-methylcytosine-specific restriction protein A